MVTQWLPMPEGVTPRQRRTIEALDAVIGAVQDEAHSPEQDLDRVVVLVYSDGTRMTGLHTIGYDETGTPFPVIFSRFRMREHVDALIEATSDDEGPAWHVLTMTFGLQSGHFSCDFVRDNPQDWVMTADTWPTIAERVRPTDAPDTKTAVGSQGQAQVG